MTIKLSAEQQAVFDAMVSRGNRGNIVLESVAGSGKTTLIVAIVHDLLDQYPIEYVKVVAFSKEIAKTFTERANVKGFEGSTMHSLGYKMVKSWVKDMEGINYLKVNGYKMWNVVDALESRKSKDKKVEKSVKFVVAKIADLVRTTDTPLEYQAVSDLLFSRDYNIDTLPHGAIQTAIDAIKFSVEWMIEKREIDFADMIYLPHALNLPPGRENEDIRFLFVDEVQDWNSLQLSIGMKLAQTGARVLAVGDPHQAIFGFAGADSNSVARIRDALQAEVMSLTYTRRCPKVSVQMVKQYVPHIQALPEAIEGEYSKQSADELILSGAYNPRNSRIISRWIAPLVTLAYDFIKGGQPARILGRDLGNTISRIVREGEKTARLKLTNPIEGMYINYETKVMEMEASKTNPRIILDYSDKVYAAMSVYYRMYDTHGETQNISEMIEDMFTEDGEGSVVMSSIHRAKGLEWENVYIVNNSEMPYTSRNGNQDINREEQNLFYVANTRSTNRTIDLTHMARSEGTEAHLMRLLVEDMAKKYVVPEFFQESVVYDDDGAPLVQKELF